MHSTKFARVPCVATSIPAPRIRFNPWARLLLPLLAPLGFFVEKMHATPLLEGSYRAYVSTYFDAGVSGDSNTVTNQPITSQTTSFSALLPEPVISAASALTLNILNDDGSDHARISANTAGNFFRSDAGPSLEDDASFGLTFSVSEAVNYSITGGYLFDLENLGGAGAYQSDWETRLRDLTTTSDLYVENEGVFGAGAKAMHLNQINEGNALYTGAGSLTGTLQPGQLYSLYYLTSIYARNTPGSGVASSTFSIDFVKAPDTDPIDPPVTNSVPDTTPTWALLGLGLTGLMRRHTSQKKLTRPDPQEGGYFFRPT